jgi:hypothetical protein
MADDYIAKTKRVPANHGITTYRIERRRRHGAVVVARAGRTITVLFPATGSDSRRGPLNTEADLRRALQRATASADARDGDSLIWVGYVADPPSGATWSRELQA